MEKYQIYEDIKSRTNGDIYVGVVGPVRVGKSTFIAEFMKKLVIPNIDNENVKNRAIDELPQSADGKTVMTTQPRFIPNEAVKISVADKINLKVRMIDCVGYLVSGAMGTKENAANPENTRIIIVARITVSRDGHTILNHSLRTDLI